MHEDIISDDIASICNWLDCSPSELLSMIHTEQGVRIKATTHEYNKRFEIDLSKRFSDVKVVAISVFEGHACQAARWMMHPNQVFYCRRPIDLMVTDKGAKEVIQLLQRIDKGIYS